MKKLRLLMSNILQGRYIVHSIVEHEGRNCAIPGRFKIFPLLRLNFSLRENSKHITSVDIAIAERGNRSGYPERSGK